MFSIFSDMIRRLIDISVSLIGLFVLLPLFLLISIWIRFDSPGPIFYRARRSGKNGKVFGLYKFRSMIVDADKNGPGITTACDTRITHSGRFLRKTKLDELPQLVNVLCGHMSLVGPRPEDPRYVELYTDTQREVLKVKPGITSAASLKFRNEAELLSGPNWEDFYRNEVMPNKLAIDLEYLSQRNLLTDGLLILRTTAAMFR